MVMEYKSVAVGGVNEVKDEGDGIITAYVSVTGVKDNVNDIIEPGAYADTLSKRKPKGVWGHSWTTPTSRTLDAKELMPGDPELPKTLSDGTPWPEEAGALQIKMQFNLETARGREAYSDVKFFDGDQEWSIGYSVPEGMARKDHTSGARRIKKLDLFEYSAVLFGANTHARTKATSVKDAQLAIKGLSPIELKSMEDTIAQWRKENPVPVGEGDGTDFVGDEDPDDGSELVPDDDAEEDEEFDDDDSYVDDDDDLDEDDVEEEAVKRLAASMDVSDLRQAYGIIGKVLDILDPDHEAPDYVDMGTKAFIEAKATGYDTISAAVEAIDVTLDPSDAKALQDAAADLDDALASNDEDMAIKAATDLFDTLEVVMEDQPDDVSLKAVARTVADKSKGTPGEDDDEDDMEGDEDADDWEDEDDDEKAKANLNKKSFTFTSVNGVQYKSVPFANREFGAVLGGEDLEAKERMNAYVSTLPNDALVSLSYVLTDVRGNNGLKSFVMDEIDSREEAGVLNTEQKMKIGRSMGSGQNGRGGGRHVQAAQGRTAGPGRNFGETGATKKATAKALKRVAKGVKKAGTSKKVVNRMTGSAKPVNPMRTKSLSPRAAELKTGQPQQVSTKTEQIDTSEMKSLEDFLRGRS